ncbi:hypothetical protein [Streptomyces sp. NBC_01294]|uniref:hypothetical protein n=1 Tax=Streptomyces sp. NBC_01294 TaxID=2903815 RepID=UPI002DD84131|nr:hypothetical protein [Streptomyces sp. NBC_01294]WRZ60896.1 hypothetical protein OG534_33035 [Streptomyces sp. NBC_01294]
MADRLGEEGTLAGGELGGGRVRFQLVVLDLARKLCRADPPEVAGSEVLVDERQHLGEQRLDVVAGGHPDHEIESRIDVRLGDAEVGRPAHARVRVVFQHGQGVPEFLVGLRRVTRRQVTPLRVGQRPLEQGVQDRLQLGDPRPQPFFLLPGAHLCTRSTERHLDAEPPSRSAQPWIVNRWPTRRVRHQASLARVTVARWGSVSAGQICTAVRPAG